MIQGRGRLLATAALLAIGTYGGSAAAQDEAQPADANGAAPEDGDSTGEEDQAGDESTITVTGSRIRGSDITTAAPTTVLNAETLTERGFVQAGQLLNETTMSRPSVPISGGISTNTGSGQQAPNLFNLGAGRTLTLVNGRRTVTTSSGFGDASTDANIIPTGLLRRIDIIQGGGAAVYGSGAMAGVVNYVLRDDFEGLTIDAQSSISSRGDYPVRAISVTAGTNILDDRANIAIDLQWSKSASLDTDDRPISGGILIPNLANQTASDGIPSQIFTDRSMNYYLGTPAGVVFTTRTGTASFNTSALLRVNGSQVTFNPDGTIAPFNAGQQTGQPGFAFGGQGYPLHKIAGLFGSVERRIGNLVAHFDITDRIKISAELLHAWTRGVDPSARIFSSNFANNGSAAAGNLSIPFNRTNAFLPASTIAALSAASPTFAAGGDLFLGSLRPDLFPTNALTTTTKVNRAQFALEGDFDLGYRLLYWSASYSYGKTSQDLHGYSYNPVNLANATRAVRATSGPNAGQIVCAINADAITTNDDLNCAPLNLFGVGNISEAARRYVSLVTGTAAFAGASIPYINEQHDFLATLGGDLLQLPGGMAKFSLSYEHLAESSELIPLEADRIGLAGARIPVVPRSAGKSSNEYAAELSVPLIGSDFTLPMVQALDLTASARLVVPDIGKSELVWGAGLRWEVIPDITLRASYSRNFRSPNLNQLFQPPTVGLGVVSNPCSRTTILGGTNPAARSANCLALFTANPNFGANQLPPGVTNTPANRLANFFDNATVLPLVLVTSGGNPDLRNEIAKTLSLGIVLRPRFIPGLTIVADRIHLDIKDALQQFTASNYTATCFDSPTPDPEICGTFTYQPDGLLATAFSRPVNIGGFKYRGEIYNLTYEFDINEVFRGKDLGRINLEAELTRNEFYETTNGLVTTRSDGTAAVPSYLLRFSAHYRNGPFRLNYTMFYQPADPNSRTDTVENYPYVPIAENMRHNISAEYRFTNLSLRAGINNFTDKLASLPVSAGVGDIIGRQFFVGARVSF